MDSVWFSASSPWKQMALSASVISEVYTSFLPQISLAAMNVELGVTQGLPISRLSEQLAGIADAAFRKQTESMSSAVQMAFANITSSLDGYIYQSMLRELEKLADPDVEAIAERELESIQQDIDHTSDGATVLDYSASDSGRLRLDQAAKEILMKVDNKVDPGLRYLVAMTIALAFMVGWKNAVLFIAAILSGEYYQEHKHPIQE